MNKIFISLDNKEFESDGDIAVSGTLKVGELNENFQASLSYWDREKYLSQWETALKRLLCGKKHSAIVTTMYDPNTANFIFWWVMYLIGDKVHIQNHVLFLDSLKDQFDESELYSFIPEREIYTEEGQLISEWVVEMSAIQECLNSLRL